MLVALKYLGRVRSGVTAPQLFRGDDRKVYVVKLQNNILGPKVLVSELLAARLGELIGLCFPPAGVIEISAELIESDRHLREMGVTPGRHFASRYLNRSRYVTRSSLKKAVNTAEMAGVVLFDHMFHNSDRTTNGKNLLLRPEEGGLKLYAIDNSHLFKSGRWTLESLKKLGGVIRPYYRFAYGRLLKDHLMPEDFLPYIEKITQISDSQIAAIVAEIPGEWLPDEDEREELVRFACRRRDMAPDIWQELCDYIPEARGGRQWWGGKKEEPAGKKKLKWLGRRSHSKSG
ncbi:MAG: hypothetical protein P4N41_07000 [Negativicutes bacterium]|nr:hypothetical protein [Negativicutes bacterium]